MWLMEFISTKYFQSWFKINYPCLNEYFTHSLQVWLDIIWGLKAWEHITQVSSGHRIANTIGSDYLVLCSVRPYFPFPFCLVLFSFLLLTPTSRTSCKNTHQSQNSATWISPKHCDKIITETNRWQNRKLSSNTNLLPDWCHDLEISIVVLGWGSVLYESKFQSFTTDYMYWDKKWPWLWQGSLCWDESPLKHCCLQSSVSW